MSDTASGVALRKFTLAGTPSQRFAKDDPVTLPSQQFAELAELGLVGAASAKEAETSPAPASAPTRSKPARGAASEA